MSDDDSTELDGRYLLVGTRGAPKALRPHSHLWRFWRQSTSFYIKPRDAGIAAVKFSLHGPDDREGLSAPGFKFGFDKSVQDRSGVLHDETFRDVWVPGLEVAPDARLVLRIRVPWDTLRPGDPSGAGKYGLKSRMDGGIVKPPSVGYAVDIDVYVGEHAPYWPKPLKLIEQDDAVALGPLRNTAGQYMTAVSVHRSLFIHPSPEESAALPPMSRADLVRGVYIGAPGGSPFAWAVESLMSRQAITDFGAYTVPMPVTLPPRVPARRWNFS